MREITKKYSNDEITVVWKPNICIHSGICFRGLPKVFNPNKIPWVDQYAADSREITAQIEKCPSGALTYIRHTDSAKPE